MTPLTANICIVDDDPITLKVLDQLLQQAGYRVFSFLSVHQALKEIPALQPDMILMDVQMKEMDGFEACRQLKENKQTASIPLLFVTIMDQPHNIVRGFESGGVDYITKPVQKRELLARISTHLNIHHYQRQLEEKNQRLEKFLDQMQALYQMSIDITRELNSSKILEETLRHLIKIFNASRGQVALYQVQDDCLVISHSVPVAEHQTGKTIQLGEGVLGTAAQKKETIIIEGSDLQSPSYFNNQQLPSFPTTIAIPLIGSNRLLGAISVQIENQKPLEFHELYFAEMFTVQASIAIENAALYDEVQRLAIIDALTGLYNRRAIMDIAQSEFQRAQRYRSPLSIIMFDIDRFKRINDQWGHLTGDEVLRELGKLCRENLRSTDIAGRYGGEEFLILLPETMLPNALETAERLRSLIDHHGFYCKDQCLHITISAGVAEAQPQDSTLDALLERVDQALYRAKAAGRNTVAS